MLFSLNQKEYSQMSKQEYQIKFLQNMLNMKVSKDNSSEQISLEGVCLYVTPNNIVRFVRERDDIKKHSYEALFSQIDAFKCHYSLTDIDTQEILADDLLKKVWDEVGIYKVRDEDVLFIPSYYIVPSSVINRFGMRVSKKNLDIIKEELTKFFEQNREFLDDLFKSDVAIKKLK